jgi:predicted nucleic acid-binding protein
VDHLARGPEPDLEAALLARQVLMHPFIMGEISLGHLNPRPQILADLASLPHAVAANDAEVMALVGRHRLWGAGIGWVDAHLLASVLLTAGVELWTRDRRLQRAAASAGAPLARH